jgi:hypothetical protein
MDLAIVLGTGALLLVLLLITRSWGTATVASGVVIESGNLARPPARALLDRCLSLEDVRFVTTVRSPEVLQLLFFERRRLALGWLRRTRTEAGRLFRSHLRAARHAQNLRPAQEVRLLFYFMSLVFIYNLLTVLIRFSGPIRTAGFLRMAHSLSHVLANLGGCIADTVAPAGLAERSPAALR